MATNNKDFRVKNGLVVEQDTNIGGNLVVTGTITGDGSALSGVTNYTSTDFAADLATKTTTNLAEGTNLYYTNARFDTQLATKSTTNLAEGTNLYYTTARANTDFDSRLSLKSTSDLTEGTNLYYTDTRVGTYLSTNSYATQTYVNTAITNLVDSAPAALDTLNELAAALGDDANFSATVTTALGNKFNTSDFNSTFDTRLATKSTTNLAEGTNLYYTDERVDDRVSSLLVAGTNVSLSYNDTANTLTVSASDTATNVSGGSASVTTLTTSSTVTHNGGTANGVAYLNGSKVLTTGSALTFDGTNLSSTGGATFQGGPTGYGGGEVRLGTSASGQASAISTTAIDSPILFFDHRGTSNTGVFAWRNGTAASNELARLTNTGLGIGTNSPAYKLHTVRSGGGIVGRFDTTTDGITDIYGYGLEITRSIAYIKGSGALHLGSAAGYSAVVVDSTGNLGIGLTSPRAKLHIGAETEENLSQQSLFVQGSKVGFANIPGLPQNQLLVYDDTVSTAGSGGAIGFGANTGSSQRTWIAAIESRRDSATNDASNYAGSLVFYTRPAQSPPEERLRINSAGNVGIGSSNPLTKLEIYGGHGSTRARLYSTGGGGTGVTGPSILSLWASEPDLTFAGSGIGGNVNGSAGLGRVDTSNGQSWIRFLPEDIQFATGTANATERMRIKAGGNVGIGTPDPESLFHIAGANPQTRLQYTGTAGGFETLTNFVDFRGAVNAAIGNNLQDDGIGTAASHLVFKTATNGLLEERVRISRYGNLGVGTTNPTAKLHVRGTAGNADPFINFEVVSPNSTFNWVSQAMASNLTGGNNLAHFIGKASSVKNSAYFAYKHSSDGSNDNILTLGLYGVDNVLNINGLGRVGIATQSPDYGLDVATSAQLRYQTYIPHTGVIGHGGSGAGTISELKWGSYGRIQHASFTNTAFLSFNAQLYESDFVGSGSGTSTNFNRIRPDFNLGSYAIISSSNGGVAFNTGMWNQASFVDLGAISTHSSYAGGWLQSGQLEVMKGIKFPGTQSASSDVNTLDDYEEGTFDPFIMFDDVQPTGVSYFHAVGAYTKVGRVVTCTFGIGASWSSGSGSMTINNLPFIDGITGGYREPGMAIGNTSWTGTTLRGAMLANSNRIIVYKGGNGLSLTAADVGTSFWLHGTLVYHTTT